MEYLTIGSIYKTHGLKGEVSVTSSTDFPAMRFKVNNTVYIFNASGERIETTIMSVKKNGPNYILKFKDYNSSDEAETILHSLVQIEKKKSDLKSGYYYHSDLIGCNVYSEEGKIVGIVSKVEEYSSQRSLRIHRDEKIDILVPFVSFYIKDIDIDAKRITVHVIEGLL